MLPGKSLAGAKHSQGIARLSQKRLAAVAGSARFFRMACAVILEVCAARHECARIPFCSRLQRR
jgi:hypothetical protein